MSNDIAILIPVKSFRFAKSRLSGILPDDARGDLARELATSVLSMEIEGGRILAVFDDHEVGTWLTDMGFASIRTTATGLNASLGESIASLQSVGATSCLIMHSDIPCPQPPDAHVIAMSEGLSVVTPDRRRDGTNLLGFSFGNSFRIAFGHHSYRRHCSAFEERRIDYTSITSDILGFDLDVPADLRDYGDTFGTVTAGPALRRAIALAYEAAAASKVED